ncbi:hypothetical protein [Pedobacter heparinus]|uniref:Uncharacterized protein n=1 Tax=Pedobacter heparinus (strain ATCC 13125 / DSM 2366 / CIP 104194 / JCM 7457 / NBRC 12017 / NCIMB 9290 / NRRL B-14731 / HIM 762-3) TaxID=485917 RepID=C6Y2X2_PEDHD|nr:hypothetical protein [Pedobacter heparinus]ACU03185.1 hypothetical protein Phep_0963 [Pedobacter heparinus DSM 2366]
MKYLKLIPVCFLMVSGWIFTGHAQNVKRRISEMIGAGDVIRTSFTDTAQINLYQGNGRSGSSYGALGLHNNPACQKNTNRFGKTQYMHISHWVRAKFNADYLIPVLKIYWNEEPPAVVSYKQHQSFYNGFIKTSFGTDRGKVAVETWFDQVDRELSGITIDVEGQVSDVIIDPMETLNVHYGQKIIQTAKIIKHEKYFEIQLNCMDRKASVFLLTNVSVEESRNKLVLKLHPGQNQIQLSYNRPVSAAVAVSRRRTVNWWNARWKQTSTLMLPDTNAQQLWVRSMGLILSTVNEDKKGFPAPMGFTGNLWPFPFPQDLSYIHSLLLSTGNIGVAKAWVEQFAAEIEGMKDYTKRLYGIAGVFCPWVFPYGDFKGYHTPGPPNIFNYEIHNSGYLCRMAYETSKFVNDEVWSRRYAYDLIEQTALFYRNMAKKGKEGYWHLYIKPAMGQDEMGGANQQDYLCALFSAKYCFQKAVELNLDPEGVYRTILLDGLAFPTLKSAKGVYFTNKAGRDGDLGKQKHPVQLNDLAYLPVNKQANPASIMAYQKRYEITQDACKPHFYGWTLGEFLLAGSRAGDVDGWKRDWANIRKADYTDDGWIQLYETSSAYDATFYTTTNALIVQSLYSNLVDDWFNKLEIAKCNPWEGKVYLDRVYSILGVKLTGEINGRDAQLNLYAWKDCQFELCGRKLSLRKGRTVKVKIINSKLILNK